MNQTTIQPGQVTRPFQLLAAWLAGLILTNGSFLGAAAVIDHPLQASGWLVWAAIANVPIFLACLFLLLTKFRAEMQEDQYYTKYIEMRFSRETQQVEKIEVSAISSKPEITDSVSPSRKLRRNRPPVISRESIRSENQTAILINDLLPKYGRIRSWLEAKGYVIERTFGSTSKDSNVPKNFVLSFNYNADIKYIQDSIRVSFKNGLDGIAVTEVSFGEVNIYIGSYSYEPGQNYFVPVTDDLIAKLLDPALDWQKIADLLEEP